MPIRTKRWNDPVDDGDGFRLLICRYRPRALKKEDETWDTWWSSLGPSRKLHADFYGKNGPPISMDEYRSRYLQEMQEQTDQIIKLAHWSVSGKTITLLCSSACRRESCCHRSLLKQLIEAEERKVLCEKFG